MKKRDLSLDQYGIDKHRYRELYNFCLQYPKWLEELKKDPDTYRSPDLTEPPGGSGTSDPTGNIGTKRADMSLSLEKIEQAAIWATPELYKYLLKHVTQDIPYTLLGIPCGANQFRLIRHRFYWYLDQIR